VLGGFFVVCWQKFLGVTSDPGGGAHTNKQTIPTTPVLSTVREKNLVQLLAMDISAPISMKNAANCDT